MKIKKFKYNNKNLDLKINSINFSNLSLLVGVSGVGKTLILRGILDLRKIAQGKSVGGVEWEIKFAIEKKEQNYIWRGAFERTELNGIEKGASRLTPRFCTLIFYLIQICYGRLVLLHSMY